MTGFIHPVSTLTAARTSTTCSIGRQPPNHTATQTQITPTAASTPSSSLTFASQMVMSSRTRSDGPRTTGRPPHRLMSAPRVRRVSDGHGPVDQPPGSVLEGLPAASGGGRGLRRHIRKRRRWERRGLGRRRQGGGGRAARRSYSAAIWSVIDRRRSAGIGRARSSTWLEKCFCRNSRVTRRSLAACRCGLMPRAICSPRAEMLGLWIALVVDGRRLREAGAGHELAQELVLTGRDLGEIAHDHPIGAERVLQGLHRRRPCVGAAERFVPFLERVPRSLVNGLQVEGLEEVRDRADVEDDVRVEPVAGLRQALRALRRVRVQARPVGQERAAQRVLVRRQDD